MASPLPAEPGPAPRRPNPSYSSLPELSKPFVIDPANRSYRHQYSNVYFVRLVELRPIVEKRAEERWKAVRGERSPVV
jgi:DNA polymerase delta subunit 2